jgi:hypothetical protein
MGSDSFGFRRRDAEPRRNVRLVVLMMAMAAPAYAVHVSLTDVAAVTTIAINVLEIKQTVAKARAAARATKRVVVKAAKKVTGK